MTKPADRNDRTPRLIPAPGQPEQTAFINLPRQRLLARFYKELHSPEGPSEEMATWWWAQY